eukprot:CAMPEP_0197400400 /NCGR_PEP_ID=MMETSP1165-20131217/16817_1 /TAXON_ID=284809 /ORGANISM="Chrysocystis fragilis, Strain CCMP3189" /LENGTH=340 /DNA_ID=CAMNT_0042926463 /DNA_START=1 /DNA_END=1022 /DNA_ORIENTATION=+
MRDRMAVGERGPGAGGGATRDVVEQSSSPSQPGRRGRGGGGDASAAAGERPGGRLGDMAAERGDRRAAVRDVAVRERVWFGDAILAMPLLTLLFGLDATTAAPLVTTVSTVMICANLAIDIRSGKMEAVGRWTESAALVAGAAAGVPVGVHALVSLDPELLRAAVGVVLIAYAAKQFAKDEPPRTALNILAVIPFGFAAGVLGGAVAEPGPPCVVLSRLAKWDPVTMRVMLQRFFLPVQLLALFDLNQEGLLTEPVLLQAVAAVPAVALAGFLGTKLNRSIDPAVFNTLIAALVLALGLLCCSTAAPYLLASIDARLPAADPSASCATAPGLLLLAYRTR